METFIERLILSLTGAEVSRYSESGDNRDTV